MTHKRAFLTTALVACAGMFIGCGGDRQTPKDAERDVRESKDVHPLTKETMNTLFQWKKESPTKLPFGRVYEVTGKVERTSIKEKGQQPEKDGKKDETEYVIVMMYLPDYSAGSVKCHFDMPHKNEVQALKKGDMLKVRGKLSDQFHLFEGDCIDLNGCLIQQ